MAPKTQTPPPDTLNRKELAAQYGYALKVIYANDEIRKLFETAVNDRGAQWTPQRFAAALRDTDWWQNNSESARMAWTAEMMGGQDWADQQAIAGSAIDTAAAQVGANLSTEQRDTMIRRYLYEGWSDQRRQPQMMRALSESIGFEQQSGGTMAMTGGSGNLEQVLSQIALNNGVKLSREYFIGAARSVASGLSTADDWVRDVRSQAASLWPTFGDKIAAGLDARELASGYINTMAQTFEIDPSQIDLSDPTIRAAMTRMSPDGKPQPMGLYEFEQSLRTDPRWMNTKQANDSIASIANDVLKSFGFVG